MKKLLFAVFVGGTVSALACSSSSTTTNPTDGGSADTGVGTTPVDSGNGNTADTGSGDTDAGRDTNNCIEGTPSGTTQFGYADDSANTNTVIKWGFTVTTDPNHCAKIKAGSTVTWVNDADFATHPLTGDSTGDTPNPIPADISTSVDAGADGGSPTVTVTFPTAGTFGYHCLNHASMKGAILVVP